jgi:hypothetical protein
MEDECTITILRSKEVVENQVEERKEEQIEIPQKPHREKEESTETSPTSTLIPEVQRSQESCLLGLCHEQIEDIKIDKHPKYSPCIIPIHDSLLDEKLFEKSQSGPPQAVDNWNYLFVAKIHSF